MSRLFNASSAETAVKLPHRPYDFVIDDGKERWTHCPICRSMNQGWWEDGQPRYSEGVLTADIAHPSIPGAMIGAVFACICDAGKAWAEKQHMTQIDRAPKEAVFHLKAAAIVWRRGVSEGPPPNIENQDGEHDLARRLRKQVGRYTRKEITLEELCANVKILSEKGTEESGRICPGIWEVLQNRALRGLYSASMHTPKDPTPATERTPYND